METFRTKEGIELEVEVTENGLVPGEGYYLDFVVRARVPGHRIEDAYLSMDELAMEVMTTRREEYYDYERIGFAKA